MACNACENTFKQFQTVVVSVQKSGSNALVFVQNQGRNIVHIRRIVLCYAPPTGGTGVLYLRPPPDGIAWTYPSAYLEPGVTANYYSFNNLPAGTTVQAQAEYIEIDGRSRSCAEQI